MPLDEGIGKVPEKLNEAKRGYVHHSDVADRRAYTILKGQFGN